MFHVEQLFLIITDFIYFHAPAYSLRLSQKFTRVFQLNGQAHVELFVLSIH